MKERIVLLYPNRHDDYGFYADLKSNPDIKLVNTSHYVLDYKMLSIVKRLIPLEKIIEHFLFFKKIAFKIAGKKYHKEYLNLPLICKNAKMLIVMDLALNEIANMDIFKQCKTENPNLKIILYLINTIGIKDACNRKDLMQMMPRVREFKWDDIYSFDKEDCKKFSYKYMGFYYYSCKVLKPNFHPYYHLFFIGCYSKERVDLINTVYKTLSKAGCRCDFHVKLWEEGYDTMVDGIHYIDGDHPLYSYSKCLEMMQKSQCILEIIRPGQNGPTLRYREAICYNKKLLTNNPNIVNFPCYNSNYMRIFNQVTDIDLDWLMKSEDINYNYNGEFSPSEMIKTFLSNLEK